MSTSINGNWEDVLAELTKRAQDVKEPEVLNRMITANAQAAQAGFFGLPRNSSVETASMPKVSVRGGTVVRVFWWGFHIEISHEDLEAFINSFDPINAVIAAIGAGVSGPAAPWITLAAAFIAGALQLLRTLDRGYGVYISMSWAFPGVFVPSTV